MQHSKNGGNILFVILVYDINIKRITKVRKICKKYLHPIQRSVFEGELTGQKLEQLKNELATSIQPKADTVSIYELGSHRYAYKWQIGIVEKNHTIL